MRHAETAVYLLGVLALAALAAAVFHGCGAIQPTRPVCDPGEMNGLGKGLIIAAIDLAAIYLTSCDVMSLIGLLFGAGVALSGGSWMVAAVKRRGSR